MQFATAARHGGGAERALQVSNVGRWIHKHLAHDEVAQDVLVGEADSYGVEAVRAQEAPASRVEAQVLNLQCLG